MRTAPLGAPWTNLSNREEQVGSANGSARNFTAPNAITLLLGSDIHKGSLALFPHRASLWYRSDLICCSRRSCLDFREWSPLNQFVSPWVFCTPNSAHGSGVKRLKARPVWCCCWRDQETLVFLISLFWRDSCCRRQNYPKPLITNWFNGGVTGRLVTTG